MLHVQGYLQPADLCISQHCRRLSGPFALREALQFDLPAGFAFIFVIALN